MPYEALSGRAVFVCATIVEVTMKILNYKDLTEHQKRRCDAELETYVPVNPADRKQMQIINAAIQKISSFDDAEIILAGLANAWKTLRSIQEDKR
jgi:hypothetical protein